MAQSTLRQAGAQVALGALGGDKMFAGDDFQRSAQLGCWNWLASAWVLRRLVGRFHVTSKPAEAENGGAVGGHLTATPI